MEQGGWMESASTSPQKQNYTQHGPSYSQAHDAALTKIDWAHPEFGQVIASSSFDRTVRVWEQIQFDGELSQAVNGTSQPASTGTSNTSKWVERAVLTDARGSVRAVQFAPHHFGLKLVRVPP